VASAPLSHRAFWLATCALIAFALWLRADVFRFEFTLDDYAQLAMLEGRYPGTRNPLDLYTFIDGSPADVQALVQYGFCPWFTHPALRLSMLRPLTSALLALDHALFGLAALPYHLHSALWWCAVLALVAHGLRSWFGGRIALFALLLFCVDESHSVALGWIVNRTALISIALSLGALFAYRRYRERGSPRDAWLCAIAFSLALTAGEYALCIAAYALAYELIEVDSPWKSRLRALTLWAAPAFVFLLVRKLGGYGAAGSDMYLDPTRNFGFFLRHGLVRLPVLLGDLVWGIPSEWWTFGLNGWTHALVALGLVKTMLESEPARTLQVEIGAVGGLVAIGLALAAIRGAASPLERKRVASLAAGGGLCLLPLLAGFPTTRALIAPMVGYSVLLAVLLSQALRRGRSLSARVPQVLAAVLCFWQLSLGTLEAAADARRLAVDANLVRDISLTADVDESRFASQRAVLLNAAHPGVPIYFALVRGHYRRAEPRSAWTLNPGFLPYWLTRTGARQLEMEIVGGTLLTGLFERVFRTHEVEVRVGQLFRLQGVAFTVLEVRDGGASRIRAEFDRPLEDPSLQFLIPSESGMSRFVPPAIGQRVFVPVPPFPIKLLRAP
jgi:hypothetical protein